MAGTKPKQMVTLTSTIVAHTVTLPEWMSPEQYRAAEQLFQRNRDGSEDWPEFLKRIEPCIGGFCGLMWCGMFVGIEPDGYTHT